MRIFTFLNHFISDNQDNFTYTQSYLSSNIIQIGKQKHPNNSNMPSKTEQSHSTDVSSQKRKRVRKTADADKVHKIPKPTPPEAVIKRIAKVALAGKKRFKGPTLKIMQDLVVEYYRTVYAQANDITKNRGRVTLDTKDLKTLASVTKAGSKAPEVDKLMEKAKDLEQAIKDSPAYQKRKALQEKKKEDGKEAKEARKAKRAIDRQLKKAEKEKEHESKKAAKKVERAAKRAQKKKEEEEKESSSEEEASDSGSESDNE